MTTETTKYTNAGAAGAEVDVRAQKYAAAHSCSYREGVIATLSADAELARAYAQPALRVTARKPLRPRPAAPAPVQMAQGNPASAEVDRRVQALIAEHPHLDYREAMGAVLHEDPALKARYAGVQR